MENSSVTDSGLMALTEAARYFDLSVDFKWLKHKTGNASYHDETLVLCKCAGLIGLEAKTIDISKLNSFEILQPCLIRRDSTYYVAQRREDDELSLYDSSTKQSVKLSMEELQREQSNRAILLSEKKEQQKVNKFDFSWFLPSLKKHKKLVKNVFLLSMFIQLIGLVTPFIFENVIDKVLVNRGLSSLEVLGIALLGLAVFAPLMSFMRSWLFANLSSKLNADLNSKLYKHLIGLPLNYFNHRQTGQITARVGEMEQIRQFLSGSALTMVLDLLFLGIFISVMFFYSSILTWIILGSLVLYFLFWLVIGSALRKRTEREYEESANNSAFLTECITGVETIKTHTLEKRFIHKWQESLSTRLKVGLKARKTSIVAEQGIGLINKLTSAIVLWWGVNLVMEAKLSPGELIAFNMLAGQVTQPIIRLAQIWQDFQQTLISLRRVGDILDETIEPSSTGVASTPALQGEVKFNKIRFKYDSDSPEVIKNLSLNVKAGEFLGITGRSGSGKSTLTKLLQRLYTPNSGEVWVDGMDIAIADPVELRRNMSIVLQDSFLFSGTVLDNIKQCLPEATNEQVINAAKLSGAHEFITHLPEQYNTQVGESGSLLSGGQKQRIALARALITDPQILILDEATSALDYESEAAIMSNMPEIKKGRTVISIAHRLSTIKGCDRIVVIDDGQAIEEGEHAELVEKSIHYKKLWELQTGF
ncbi:type I secretion system permease/ATPase [Parashewanella curva]|uniref:Type I secretion system permease/ATPase n=2 Tax=Parashewanella curva TaxID=2338552 RepID=A0A3L8PVY5_9GAMM|nr:type I secretion system permease/ATPase [Parashewanella curva]